MMISLCVAVFVALVGLVWWVTRVPVKVAMGHGKEIERLIAKTPSVHSPWHAVPWLLAPGLQTAASTAWRRKPNYKFDREILPISDGAQIGLDWLAPQNPQLTNSSPVLIILHGMSGGSKETYLQHLIKMATRRFHCRVVVMIHRGLAGVPMTHWKPYNAGLWIDIKETCEHVHRKYPDAPLLGVGYSLGASVLTHYVCEAKECLLAAAVAVSSPIDLVGSCDYMNETSTGRQMSKFMTTQLVRYTAKNAEALSKCPHLDGPKVIEELQKVKDVSEYDAKGTSKIFGYPDAHSYYVANSTHQLLHQAKVPLLLVNSFDDPVVGPVVMNKVLKIVLSDCSNVAMAVTKLGGHVAFLEAKNFNPLDWIKYEHSWADRVCCEFLSAALSL